MEIARSYPRDIENPTMGRNPGGRRGPKNGAL
jgi:hypothetical protein